MKMIFLVDGDNNIGTGLQGIDLLTAEDTVLVFFGKGQTLANVKKLCAGTAAQVQYLESVKGGKNSLDFQIITELGVLVGRGEADFAYVSRCGFPPDRGADLPAGSVGAAYRSWEFALRGEIARLRVAEGHGDAIDLPPETDAFADIREQIGGAASAPNPLERERRVDQLRWRRLDELAFGHEFTVEAVACYRLRLAILEKNRQFVAETGRNNFEEAVGLIDRNSAE